MHPFENVAIGNGMRTSPRRDQPVPRKAFATKAKAEARVTIVESEMERGVFVSRAEAETTTH